MREFHISKKTRDAYDLPDTLFSVTGNVVFADFRAARELAHRINEKRDVHNHPERAVRASRLYAMGLIDEVLHLVVAHYRQERAPQLWAQVLTSLAQDLGQRIGSNACCGDFVDDFPPTPVYRGEVSRPKPTSTAKPMGWRTASSLPRNWSCCGWQTATRPFPTFASSLTTGSCGTTRCTTKRWSTSRPSSVDRLPEARPGETLLDRLYAPMRAAPTSLEGQLAFIRGTWAEMLGPELHRVLGSLDFIDRRATGFLPSGAGRRSGPLEPQDFARPLRGGRKLLCRSRLDAAVGASGEERPRVARSAEPEIRARDHDSRRCAGRGARRAREVRVSPVCG